MTTVPGGTETFYELTLDTAAGNKRSSCTLKVFENPPSMINPIDLSSVRAGRPT